MVRPFTSSGRSGWIAFQISAAIEDLAGRTQDQAGRVERTLAEMNALAEGVKKSRDAGYWWGDYGSPLRDAALSYTLLQRHRIKADSTANLVALAAAELEKNRWTSTQEKLALFLLGRELGNPEKGSTWSAELTDKNKAETISGPGGQTRGVTAASLADGLKIRNTHKDKLFVELAVAGHPSKMPASRSDVIALKREIYDANGKLVGDKMSKSLDNYVGVAESASVQFGKLMKVLSAIKSIAGVVGSLWLRPLMSLGYSTINLLLTPLTALLR